MSAKGYNSIDEIAESARQQSATTTNAVRHIEAISEIGQANEAHHDMSQLAE